MILRVTLLRMTSLFSKKIIPLAMLGAVLQGCASAAPKSEIPEPLANVQTQLDGSIRYDTDNQRLARLWSAAEQARRANNDEEAIEILYLAIEVSPNNSMLWSRAAEIQLDNDQALIAENMALKSNAFAGENPDLLHRNWLIIEHARSLRGDLLGVRSARKQVEIYQDR